MRRSVKAGAIWALAALLAGCASGGSVMLLDAEPGADVGAVAVFAPKDGAEIGVLDKANTETRLNGRVQARPGDPSRYATLVDSLPKPGARFTLYFLDGSTQLSPESETVLQQLLEEVARRPGAEVQITGHTDTVGSVDDNDTLSRQRALEIRAALGERGLNPAIARAVGRGERELLTVTADGVSEPTNRRVEVTVR